MKCPICIVDLQMTDRQGIEIDYCPKCRGVWLDRGELDKIIEKSSVATPAPAANQGAPINGQRRHEEDYHDDHGSDQRYGYGKKRKKEGLLGELFDF